MFGVRLGAIVLGVALVAAAPVHAQEAPPDTEPTTTASTAPPPTDPELPTTLPEDPTATTLPGESTTTTTAPPEEDPAANGDAPPETVPEVVFTIPPRLPDAVASPGARYAGQGSFATYPGRLVRVTARTARARAAETQASLDAAVAMRDVLLARRAELRAEIGQLAAAERNAIEAMESAQSLLEERAADAYIRGDLSRTAVLFSSSDASEFSSRMEIMEVVFEADQAAIEAFQHARAGVDEEQAATARDLAEVSAQIGNAEQAVWAAQSELTFATRELAVSLAGGNIVIHGFTFPVAADFSYIDSFGFPRMTGTEFEHWHEGTDIFAPAGTELLAAERGVVARMGTNVLGGITVWLQGESRTRYYYAHLSGFAPGIGVGEVVEAGTVLGYVGNTGNAATTPPHLHFEIHPNGGDAVNPYPILVVAEEQPQPEPIRL